MMNSNDQVMLRGSVYETGEIHSFWTKTNQKNLIACFFELPKKEVGIGDTWELDINFIQNDQNFICDSSSRINEAKLIDIKRKRKQTIAVLEYNISEYVSGTFNSPLKSAGSEGTQLTMTFKHKAVAEFSVDEGRWISYEGILDYESSGFMSSSSVQKLSLTPIE